MADLTTNHILTALPRREYGRIASSLHAEELSPGSVLCESGERLSHVYFPNRGMVSLVSLNLWLPACSAWPTGRYTGTLVSMTRNHSKIAPSSRKVRPSLPGLPSRKNHPNVLNSQVEAARRLNLVPRMLDFKKGVQGEAQPR